MTLQELISQIESNLIDTIVDNGVNLEDISGASEARDNLRQLLQGAAIEAVQEQPINTSVPDFISNFTGRATNAINTQIQQIASSSSVSGADGTALYTISINEIKDTISIIFMKSIIFLAWILISRLCLYILLGF